MSAETKPWGLLAQYKDPHDIYEACERVRDAGYTKWDACTPFPVHGLDKAMGVKSSPLPWIVLVVGICGSTGMLLFQWWAAQSAYPIIVGGKPLFSLPAFVPIWYEITVLSSCVTAFLANWILNGLPQHHHPAFTSKAFERVTDDAFFIIIESSDPQFDSERTKALLAKTGATLIEGLQNS